MEALECIYPEELVIESTKPYKFEVQINSNADAADNYLKVKLIVEMPPDYPQNIPFMRLKNLSPEYLDNKMLDDFEGEIREKARENIGN